MAVNERTLRPWARRPDVRIGAVVAVAIAAAFVIWLLVRGNDSNSPSPTGTQTVSAIAPVAATPERLRELSVDVGRPIYWAGPRSNDTYELTRTSQDRIYIRYLPSNVSVGTSKADYTIVGTYPVANAYDVLKTLAKTTGHSSFSAPDNGFAVYSTSQPTNVYLAYPGSNVQIEVFDPSAERAHALVTSGQVGPVR
jgi:ferric-dicitrate binding protein FerR (iron transport regulator)